MSEDIMVDLETIDSCSTSGLLSIGACRINWAARLIEDPFYVVVCPDSCKAVGLTESEDTMKWWARQSEEARRVFTDPNVPLPEALHRFTRYLSQWNRNKVRIWGNGSDFDNVILANAYKACGSVAPWRFYNNRCFRTMKNVFSDVIKIPERGGTHHNALDDAVFQAEVLLQLKGKISGT